MPTGVFIFFTAVGVLTLTIFAARRLVCGKPWSTARKKAVFAAVCALAAMALFENSHKPVEG